MFTCNTESYGERDNYVIPTPHRAANSVSRFMALYCFSIVGITCLASYRNWIANGVRHALVSKVTLFREKI